LILLIFVPPLSRPDIHLSRVCFLFSLLITLSSANIMITGFPDTSNPEPEFKVYSTVHLSSLRLRSFSNIYRHHLPQ
ncbi:hypothetical protein ILYODFUR_034849, partial [Ilyodon furcidens]